MENDAEDLIQARPADLPAGTEIRNASPVAETSFLSVVTLVLWAACLTVGGLGLALSYSRPHPPAKAPEPVQAELLNVELTNEPLPPPEATPTPPDPTQPPPLLDPVVTPPAPTLLPVAEPNPAIAFALPVEGPTRIIEPKQAAYLQIAAPVTLPPAPAPVAPPAQPLTFGSGEGKQPAPDYPFRAAREGQEGAVGVRFSVGENGRVLAAEAVSPCPWPLLNEAALRAVRERWRFRTGAVRLYEVSIRFELKK
jgi:protein TonB